jgi:hypothetical protein
MRISVLWVLLAANGCGQELDSWKMIPAKSRDSSGSLSKAITVKYEIDPKEPQHVETWTIYQVRADGTSETTSQTLRFDGKEYASGDLGLEERPDTVVATDLGRPDSAGCPTQMEILVQRQASCLMRPHY